MRTSANLAGNMLKQWLPRSHDFYGRQWHLQRGAWQGVDDGPENPLDRMVFEVIAALRTRGTAAGLIEASRHGVLPGAHAYVASRASTEPELAARLAQLRAVIVKSKAPHVQRDARIKEAFLRHRLEEVRDASGKGHTPPQAVADKPDVAAAKRVPWWLPYVGLAISGVVLVKSLQPRGHR